MSRKPPIGRKRPPKTPAAIEIPFSGLIASLVATLLMLRYLVPAESAAEGHTLWIVQAWLFVGLLWAMNCFRERSFRVRLGWFDAAVWLLVLGHVAAALAVVFTEGHKRAAINMLWEWIGLGISYFLVRQTLHTLAARQQLLNSLAVMFVALAGLGLWQHYVWYPNTAREYQELRSELDQIEPGTTRAREIQLEFERQGIPSDPESLALWEQRLQSSSEPFGLFALANTFAGLLAVSLIILLGNALRTRGSPVFWSVWLPAIAIVGFCLVLTKSRTAWVGLVVGLVFWLTRFLVRHRSLVDEKRSRSRFAWSVSILVAIATFIGIAMLSRGIDREVLSEAPKSLKYRVEYWTGTWSVIKERPVLGTGPGNFRQHYLKHKLPESSEEIAAPHNLVLDVWANGGSVSLGGLLVFLAVSVWLALRVRIPEDPSSIVQHRSADTAFSPFVKCGLFASFGILLLKDLLWGQPIDFRIVGLMVGAFVLSWLMARSTSQIEDGSHSIASNSVISAAGLALLVHLLGADGIAMPAVTQSLLVLFAFFVSADEHAAEFGKDTEGLKSSRLVVSVCAGLAAGLSFICLVTGTLPVFNREIRIDLGDAALLERNNFRRATAYYAQAAEADPFSPKPLERLAGLMYQQSLQSWDGGSTEFIQATKLAELAIEHDPFSSNGHRRLGNRYLKRFERSGNKEDAKNAVKSFKKAQQRYPNNARLVSEFAAALSSDGDHRADETAARALWLDRINRKAGHRDRFLPDETRQGLIGISDEKRQKTHVE